MFLLPFSALAESDSISRRDGYLLLWESISRPAFETKQEYKDVPEQDLGHLELSFGKRRGILPDEDYFRPNEPLLLGDALLWLYRTRNIRELPDMQQSDLPSMINQYPVLKTDKGFDSRITSQELISFARTLDQMLIKEVHEVSFYADDFHGRGTAFGDVFDMHALTAAHRSFPSNTLVKVTNVENEKYVIVRINDRGPYIDGRNMDLSKAAFESIAPAGQGLLRATFERLGHMDLVDRCEQKQRLYQKRVTRDVHFYRGVPHAFTLGDQLILQSNKPFVIQSITFPDGDKLRIQDFVLPKEKYRFSPDMTGRYTFHVGNTRGSTRELRMRVSACLLPN